MLMPYDSQNSKKIGHPFSHLLIFGNMFPASDGFVAMPGYKLYQRYIIICVPIYPYLISEGRRNCST